MEGWDPTANAWVDPLCRRGWGDLVFQAEGQEAWSCSCWYVGCQLQMGQIKTHAEGAYISSFSAGSPGSCPPPRISFVNGSSPIYRSSSSSSSSSIVQYLQYPSKVGITMHYPLLSHMFQLFPTISHQKTRYFPSDMFHFFPRKSWCYPIQIPRQRPWMKSWTAVKTMLRRRRAVLKILWGHWDCWDETHWFLGCLVIFDDYLGL